MAKKSDQVVDTVFKLQEMITMQQAQLQALKDQMEIGRKDAQVVKEAIDGQAQTIATLRDHLQQQVEEVGKKVKGVLDIITP